MGTPVNLKLAIRMELTELLYRNLALGLISIFFLISIVFWQLFGYEESYYLVIWYIALSFNLLCGLILIYWYHQTHSNPTLLNYHYYLYITGSTLTALFLGLLGSILMPADIIHQALIIIVIMCIVGGAVQGLLASYLASSGYLIFTLLPLLAWEFQQILHGHQIFIGIFIATIADFIYLTAEVYTGHQTIENNIKLKLENMNITQELKQQKSKVEFLSEHDVLTTLYNRRYLEDILSTLKKRTQDLSVFMFDIDFFKTFNDRLGHEAGDAILRELGSLIKIFFRQTDLSFRYGGEEFLIILDGMSADSAIKKAEAFRLTVKKHPVQLYQKTVSITISGGIATLPIHGQTITDVIKAADKALYKAKNSGRDQIKLASAISHPTSTFT